MTTQEAAECLGITRGTVLVQIRNGRLSATKHGRDWNVSAAAVERYRRLSLGTYRAGAVRKPKPVSAE